MHSKAHQAPVIEKDSLSHNTTLGNKNKDDEGEEDDKRGTSYMMSKLFFLMALTFTFLKLFSLRMSFFYPRAYFKIKKKKKRL